MVNYLTLYDEWPKKGKRKKKKKRNTTFHCKEEMLFNFSATFSYNKLIQRKLTSIGKIHLFIFLELILFVNEKNKY